MEERTVAERDPRAYFCALLGVDADGLSALVAKALKGAEDGELYLERADSESISLDDGRISSPSRSIAQGFGLRRVSGESVLYASGSNVSPRAIIRAGNALRQADGERRNYVPEMLRTVVAHYSGVSPLSVPLEERVRVLSEVDMYLRRDPSVTNVSASISGSHTQILIVRADGTMTVDLRPLVLFNLSVECERNGKREKGAARWGGRHGYDRIIQPSAWIPEADRAKDNAFDRLRAEPCPSGEMTVVLGNGWAGVLLHEAVGHGLEGDSVWRKETVYADMLGKRIGSDLVTVVDDGTIAHRRGSITVDDEGTPAERTVLIEKGIIVNFMQDRQSARILGARLTGNGRRESYAHRPQVRMRNTYMLAGATPPEEIIRSTKKGLYMPTFAGGSVDPITGAFVFKAELAYKIEDGKVTTPVVGATLIGNCATVLLHVDMVGTDVALDHGGGSCGKGGQWVPVGVGQPTIRLSGGVSVGGTVVENS